MKHKYRCRVNCLQRKGRAGPMKSKLFIKFLFLMLATSLSVVVLMVVGMQFFVYRNFSDYVVQQELDSLDGLAATLSKQYSKSNSWKDFKEDPRQWHDMLNSYFPARCNPSSTAAGTYPGKTGIR